MNVFTIDAHHAVTRFTANEQAPPGGDERFTSEKELAKLAAKWPAGRLVELWNQLPGVRRVSKFTDRKTAVHRIWKTVQELAPAQEKPPTPGAHTKTARVIALLEHPAGATLKAIMAMTGWQSHSVRGFISAHVIKKMGRRVQSFTRNGERVYRIRPGPSVKTEQDRAERRKK